MSEASALATSSATVVIRSSNSRELPIDFAARSRAACSLALRLRASYAQIRSSACPAATVTASSIARSVSLNGAGCSRATTTTTGRPSSVRNGATIAPCAPMPRRASPPNSSARFEPIDVTHSDRSSSLRADSWSKPTAEIARAGRRSSPPSSRQTSSASKTSQSSSMKWRARSPSLEAALTRPMIAARLAASTKRRLRELSREPPGASGDTMEDSAEGNCDDGMVSVPLGSSEPRHLAMRVEAYDRRLRVPHGCRDRLHLLRDAVSERSSPAGAVEDERRLRVRAAELVERGLHRFRPARHQLVVVELGELDHGTLRDAGPEDDRPLLRPPKDVAEPEVSVELGLGDRVGDRHRLELIVVERQAGEAELLEVDLLGRAPVDLLDGLPARPREDGGRPAGPAALGFPEPGGAVGGERNRHDAVRGSPAVVEVALLRTAGRTPGERHAGARRLVGAGDRVGYVAAGGLDQEQDDLGIRPELLDRL